MPDSQPLPPLLVDRTTAGKLLGCCARSIDAMIRAGELRAVRIGRRVLLDPRELQRWVDGRLSQAGVPQKATPNSSDEGISQESGFGSIRAAG